MNHNGNNIESRLWAAADELRANSKLKSAYNKALKEVGIDPAGVGE